MYYCLGKCLLTLRDAGLKQWKARISQLMRSANVLAEASKCSPDDWKNKWNWFQS